MASPDYSDKPWTRRSERGKTVRERFDQKVDKSGDCWLWMGAKTSRGYGVLTIERRSVYVHRLALELDGRSLLPGQFACHHCDVPACVNPSHIYAGSASDNQRDAVRRGRWVHGDHDYAAITEKRRAYYIAHPDRHPGSAKTHCPQGHEYTPDNTYRDASNHRKCRTCTLARNRAADHRRRRENPKPPRLRPTVCPQGHPYDAANTYVSPSGSVRYCRRCSRERMAARRSA